MKLIVVTTPTFFVEEDKIITALFEEGLDVLHLRKPETPAMYSERLLTLIPDKYHRRIVTHEHFYLKEEFNLMGIHLNARNPKEPHDYYGHISCSCHSVEEVKNRKQRIMGHNGFKEAAMVDDYTAKMTELIELMRLIGNDTQQCEVKECKRKISSTITDTLSAFSNGSGGWIILGLSEKNGFTPVEGFDARAMQEALSQACEKMTPVVRPVIVTCPFEGANLVFARIDEMLPRDKPCFTTALGPHGGSFIRTGDGDRRMTSYEVDRLIEEHLQPTYDLDIVPDATTDDLDPQLVAGLLARVREQHPRVFADRDGIDVLLDLQVLRHDDSDESEVGGILRPTLAGLLALGH